MKTVFSRLALASLVTAGAVHAAPFSGKGLPADAAAIVHVDADAAGNSSLVKTLRDLAEQTTAASDAKQKQSFEKLKAEFGVDLAKDVRDITVVLFTPAGSDAKLDGVAYLHGKFDAAKFNAVAKTHPEVVANKAGSRTWYSLADLGKAFGEATKPGKEDKGLVCLVDASTLILTGEVATLTKALAAVDSGAAYADASGKKTLASGAIVSGYFPEAFVAAAQAGKPRAPGSPVLKSGAFTLNETAGNLVAKVAARFTDEKGAAQANQQAAMYLGFGQMMLAQTKPDASEKDKADTAFFLSALTALKVGAAGDTLNVDFSYPAEKLAAKLREKRADIAAAAAQQAAAVK